MSTVYGSVTRAELNRWFAGVDAANEADPSPEQASDAVIEDGQAAVDALNALRGRA